MEIYDRREERTGVQDFKYVPGNNTACDFVMIYGTDSLKKYAKEWKKRGYVIHCMTGVSWGSYQDYLYGKFDGIDHHDEGQRDRNGNEMNHGKDVPYMVPSCSFSHYLAEKLKCAVDNGAEAIHLEEPEFWMHTGYSDGFKREWKNYYKEDWQDPQSSCEAQYKASKLKQYLYTRMLDRLCSELKEYALKKYGRFLRFYVPTHSLINYCQWKICSPESALVDLPAIDGYIAQIWTGTSRTVNYYDGVCKERTFEGAYLEYGLMQELVRGTGRKMWYLHDPVEDDGGHTWTDYRQNYYRTVTASLLHPEVYNFEICPWPFRVFGGKYLCEDKTERVPMPEEYRTNLLTIMNTLRDMKQDDVKWDCNINEIGVMIADSMMYQRLYPEGDPRHTDCDYFSQFFGLAMPLLKNGLAVRPIQLENIRRKVGYLNAYKAIVMSYEFLKPETPDLNTSISGWVRDGGVLIYVGDGSDSFHKVPEWWNTDADYNNPAEHLFELCGLSRKPKNGIYQFGNGYICIMNEYSAKFAESAEEAAKYREFVKKAIKKVGIKWKDSSTLILERGPYNVTAVMDETPTSVPYTMKGKFVNLYETYLPVVENPVLDVGSVGLWYNLSKIDKKQPVTVIAAAARLDKYKATARSCSFTAISASDSEGVIRLYVKRPPVSVTLNGAEYKPEYDEASKTLLFRFANSDEGVKVKIKFCK